MNCPICNEELTKDSEVCNYKPSKQHITYIDKYGNTVHAPAFHYLESVTVVYECDSGAGCEALWHFNTKTKRLDLIKPPLVRE